MPFERLRQIMRRLRDPKTDTLSGRFGLGDGAERVSAVFKVSVKTPGDLFAE